MPNFPQYSPWQEASQSFGNLGGIAQQIAVGLAQQRFQQEMARQQMALKMAELAQQGQLYRQHGELYKQQGALYESQKAHYDTTTQALKDAADAAQGFGTAVATQAQYGMPKYADEGPIEHDIRMANLGNAPYEANRQAAVLSALGKHFVPQNMAQIAYQNTSPQAQAALAMGGMNKLYQNVPQGAVGVPLPGSGLPTIAGGFNLAPENQRYAPQASFDLNSILGGALAPMGQMPVATGGPKSFTPGADPRLRELSTWGNILGHVAPSGIAPMEGDALLPVFQQATNRIAQLQAPGQTNRVGMPSPQGPKIGEVRKGYRFKGGDPSKQESWEKVQ